MIRLFAIPYAFGGANIYYDLEKEIDENIELIPVEYSGHAGRFSEPLIYNIQEIATDAYTQIADKIRGEYAILGYSMGGIVAYELFRIIKEKGKPLPKCIMAFGSTEPDFKHKGGNFEEYDVNQIRDLLIEFGGTPPELLEDEQMLEVISTIVISDSIALRDYVPSPCEEYAISVPLTVLRGDKEEKLENCECSWRRYCTSDFTYCIVPGEHFFMFEKDGARTAEFARMIETIISRS